MSTDTAYNLRIRIEKLEAQIVLIEAAFVKDEDGKPDFSGHRVAHKAWMSRVATLGGWMSSATGKALTFVAGAGLLFVGQLIMAYFK